MSPTLHIVRHAEGFHNTAHMGESIHDPFLTPHGEEQCHELRSKFSRHDNIELLMASPMKRTIQTCQLSFQPCVDRGLKILTEPLAQESSSEPMDTGSAPSEIANVFGDLVDLRDTTEHWNKNVGIFASAPESMLTRARKLRKLIRDRPEREIALVTHGVFAHALTGNYSDLGEQLTRQWGNTELRTFTFADDDEEDARLVETQESVDSRPDLEYHEPTWKRKDSPVQ